MKKLNKKNLLNRFRNIDVDAIQDEGLRKKARKLKNKQGGFTLLELLVVVAILAAIAGTATIALQDTDARAAAAAHVAMMDEMNKGIRTYRVLNRGVFPNGFDSLIQTTSTDLNVGTALLSVLAIEDVEVGAITSDQFSEIATVGLSSLNYVALDQDPADFGDCGATTSVQELIASRNNAVVAGNIFLSANGNGCGVRADFTNDADGNGTADDNGYIVTSQAAPIAGATQNPVAAAGVTANLPVALWTGGAERVTGQAEPGAYDADDNTVFLATGLGPASSLFAANEIGGMTSVPVYRHVAADEYNRFIAIWDIGTYDSAAANGITMGGTAALVTVVDGAGDTKEEELGEWDGSRNTI